jgi:PKHD-type hydroxylase
MFTQSLAGHGYGLHIDNPYMPSGRSDLSFTLFLSPPEEYKGGELCIQTINKTEKIKLSAGEIVIYPSTHLHSVAEVKSGERYVCVGWVQSYIQNNEDRNFLFGLDAGAKGLLAKHGRSDELDLIFQAYSNILRRLGD